MSAITIENDLVHYEVLGRGRPVILVHGWLGSWRYWIPTMQQLSVKYRIYALDLWGFGDSEKDAAKYGFASQVKLLADFMDKLGITKAALVGHALGAAIAINFAKNYPERAPRVMLVSAPLFDMGGLKPTSAKTATANMPTLHVNESTNASSQESTHRNTDDTLRRNPFLDNPERLAQLGIVLPTPNSSKTSNINSSFSASTPVAAPDMLNAPNPLVTLLSSAKPKALLERQGARTDENLEKLLAEVNKMDENVLSRSASSFAGVNLALELHQLVSPTLLLHGRDDAFLPAPSDELLGQIAAGKPDGAFLPFVAADFRHFPMLENTTKFNRLLLDFLDAPDLTNVHLKETWRRQLR